MRYRLDRSVQRFGHVLLGGSPLRLFRLTRAGSAVVDRLAAGEPVDRSKLLERLLDAGAVHPVVEPRAGTDALVTTVMPVRDDHVNPPDGTVVVDDGSDPPLAISAVRLPVSRGPGAARMAGLDLVTTPLVAFVDADVRVPDGWLDALVAHFDDERVALVAPRVRSEPGTSLLARYEERRSPLDLGDDPARIRAGTKVSYVPAAAIVCRVAALREVGGFDQSLGAGEDVDLVWRLDEGGWTCRYEPAVEVWHRPRRTWPAWIRQRITYGASAAPLSRRHPGALAPVRMSGWSAAAWLLAIAGRPVSSAAIVAGTSAALVRKLPDVPPQASVRLAALGTLRAGESIASAVRRVWWPIVAVAALFSRRARLVAVASAALARSPIRVLDDLAYGAGVWRGMWRERTLDPLVPDLTSWPGRTSDPRYRPPT
ncbi:MAG TPA: mycofactocin biosynthesis glycosyltransferase MftF [Ilumatobacteraceae bacterium]